MKELSIEEKAKAYDEALKVLHKYDGAHIMFTQDLKEEMFPELREEYEDERMVKFIKNQLFNIKKTITDNYKLDTELTEAIDWLEKQGEHTNFRNKIQIGDKVTRNEDGVLVNLSQLKRVAKKDEKQGEQKPADKQFTPEQASVLNKHIDKFLKQKNAWSEEDEKMYNVVHDLAWESYKTSRRLDIPTFGIINDWLSTVLAFQTFGIEFGLVLSLDGRHTCAFSFNNCQR